jgi:hypothetical protein
MGHDLVRPGRDKGPESRAAKIGFRFKQAGRRRLGRNQGGQLDRLIRGRVGYFPDSGETGGTLADELETAGLNAEAGRQVETDRTQEMGFNRA